MNLEEAREIAVAVSNNIIIEGITNEEIGKAFEISSMAGDFILEGVLYENVSLVLK